MSLTSGTDFETSPKRYRGKSYDSCTSASIQELVNYVLAQFGSSSTFGNPLDYYFISLWHYFKGKV